MDDRDVQKVFLQRQKDCKQMRAEAHQSGKSLCHICDFTGMYSMIHKENGGSYAFRCTRCKAADMMGMTDAFSSLTEDLREKFEVHK